MRRYAVTICIALSIYALSSTSATAMSRISTLEQTPLFVSGENGYDTYRIPALAVTNDGTILAFCEGRMDGRGDAGNIDMLLKRSTDGGKTWSKQQVIWDDDGNTCGNPAPVVDAETGTIHLLMTWNRGDDHERDIIDGKSKDTRRVYVTRSTDDGKTWTDPKEITSTTKLSNWTWYATGPGAGIQLQSRKHKSRLVIPCDHIQAETKHYYSHVIYSDDHGKTWQLGGTTPHHQVNECQVVEQSNGNLMLNMRNYDRANKQRQVAISKDGGDTWIDQHFDQTLIEPICQASIRRIGPSRGKGNGLVLFSNPASETKRENMTVRISRNNGKTWPEERTLVLYEGPSAYSDLAILSDDTYACLYERGNENPYETITFSTFELIEFSGYLPNQPSFRYWLREILFFR
ncbi:MAG: sialidase family protein [Candidatus Hydrogenedentota bacterium]